MSLTEKRTEFPFDSTLERITIQTEDGETLFTQYKLIRIARPIRNSLIVTLLLGVTLMHAIH